MQRTIGSVTAPTPPPPPSPRPPRRRSPAGARSPGGSPMTPRHILILTDRDWTHPQAGGTGTHLYGLVSRWLAWGHKVTVIAGDHPGAEPVEHPAPNLR